MLHNKLARLFQYTQGALVTQLGYCDYYSPISLQRWVVDVRVEDFSNKDIQLDGVMTIHANTTHISIAIIHVKEAPQEAKCH